MKNHLMLFSYYFAEKVVGFVSLERVFQATSLYYGSAIFSPRFFRSMQPAYAVDSSEHWGRGLWTVHLWCISHIKIIFWPVIGQYMVAPMPVAPLGNRYVMESLNALSCLSSFHDALTSGFFFLPIHPSTQYLSAKIAPNLPISFAWNPILRSGGREE